MMNRRSAIRNSIIIWSVVLVLAAGAFVAAVLSNRGNVPGSKIFSFGFNLTKYDRSKFVEIKSKTFSGDITSVDLDWISGEVHITKSENDEIKIIQKGMENFPEEDLFRADASHEKLTINDGRSGTISIGFNIGTYRNEADLYVCLPEKMFESIKADCVSSSISAPDIRAAEIDLVTVSGNISFSGDAGIIRAKTVSGKITGTIDEASEASIITTSGAADISGAIKDADIKTISGKIRFDTDILPSKFRAETISGDILVVFPENKGFEVDFSKVSGALESDFAFAIKGARHTYKDGGVLFTIKTVSGDAVIRKK